MLQGSLIFTSPNLFQRSTVLNAGAADCYIPLSFVENLITTSLAHNKLTCGSFSSIISLYNSSLQNYQKFMLEVCPAYTDTSA